MIRRAVVTDLPRLQLLLEQILRVHHEVRPDIFKPSGRKFSDAELEQLIHSENTPVFVFEDDKGEIVGHLFVKIIEKDAAVLNPIKTLFIDDLCVDSSARGQGVGQKLYQFALDYARQIGCYNVTLNVWNANQGALRFYENQGMTAQATTMEKILE